MNNRMALNMTEVGELLGRSRWHVQAMIRDGLPFIPTGKRHKLILVSELEKYLKSRQTTA